MATDADPADDIGELDAELDQAIAEGGFTPLGERALRTVRTVPISLRLPEPLLACAFRRIRPPRPVESDPPTFLSTRPTEPRHECR
jgi:hypothetical protein